MVNSESIERSFFYSPFSFIRGVADLGEEWLDELKAATERGGIQRFVDVSGIVIFFKTLKWDSDFFGIPFFKVEFVDFPEKSDLQLLQNSFSNFRKWIASSNSEFYIFAEIPCEDTGVVAGMTGAGWRLVETRVTCFRDDLQKFSFPRRSSVRNASLLDISALRKAAVDAVNHYDRFHADDFFSEKESSDFLGIFIENSVKGFADEVIVPSEGEANAFLTGNYVVSPLSLSKKRIGKMVLSAVTGERKGWYTRLISELSYKFKDKGLDTVFMTTQATNRAVLKVWAHHGYQFGRCSHIFSTYSRIK